MIIQLFGIDLFPQNPNWLNIVSMFVGILISIVSLYGIVVILPKSLSENSGKLKIVN